MTWCVCMMLALCILSSCATDSKEKTGLDRSLILKNVAENLIGPAQDELMSSLANLSEKATALSTTTDEATLLAVRSSWEMARIQWARVEIYAFGPIKDLALATKYNNWPINDYGLEASIAGKSTYTASDVAALPSNQTGFTALEYLLYGEDALQKLQESEGRRSMLVSMVEVLKDHTQRITAEWKDNYSTKFTTSTGMELGSSASLLSNAFVESVQDVSTYKISIPLGFQNDGSALPQQVEAQYANISKELIVANLQAQKALFNGTGAAGPLNGFDDYLDALEADNEAERLSAAINQQFDLAIAAAQNISGTVEEAVVANPLAVNNVATELQKLLILLKTDMMSRMGLVLTFSDNDGD